MLDVTGPTLQPIAHEGSRGWTSGALELLLVGGSTPLLLLGSWWLRASHSFSAAELVVGGLFFYAAYLINDPHFAVTYVLFYRDARARAFGSVFPPAQRLRYLCAGLVAPLLLLGWALYALSARSVLALGSLFQLMFLLVGFHYVKQGFGVLTVLASRRGVRFQRAERRVLLAHCYAGWAYAWASPADLGTRTEQKGLVYSTFAHPVGLERATWWLFVATVPALVGMLFLKRRREGPLPLCTPLLAFLCSIWSWTIFSSFDPLVRYAIPALHSVQYLYLVWLLQGSEAREREGPPWFAASATTRLSMLALTALLLGWLLFHGAPAALDGLFVARGGPASALGPTPYFAALFAFVNLHHYLMDMVIWRRDNPLTRYLHVVATARPTREQ
ncbi:MAG: hypothetical protein JWN48_3582 [Myxococcaceae bacterium]|nr:hypothetical protein [Myxococcaceae bacterium]